MSFLTSLRPTTPIPLLLHHFSRPFTTTPRPLLARMTIVGRLADSPEIVPTSTGQDVVRYALGTSAGSGDNRQTSWWKVASFIPEGPGREALVGLGKGSLLCVEGECSMRKFQTKEGTAASALSIVQKNFEVLDRRDPRAEGQGQGQGPVEGEEGG